MDNFDFLSTVDEKQHWSNVISADPHLGCQRVAWMKQILKKKSYIMDTLEEC